MMDGLPLGHAVPSEDPSKQYWPRGQISPVMPSLGVGDDEFKRQ